MVEKLGKHKATDEDLRNKRTCERVYTEVRGNCGNEVGQNGCGGGGGGGWITFLPSLRRYLPVSKVPFGSNGSQLSNHPHHTHSRLVLSPDGEGGRREGGGETRKQRFVVFVPATRAKGDGWINVMVICRTEPPTLKRW